jgi:hypothetical protein
MNATLKEMTAGLGELTAPELATLLTALMNVADEGARMEEGNVNEGAYRRAADHIARAALLLHGIK